MKAERPALVRDPHHPVPMLFHLHTWGSDRRMNLIESSLLRKGKTLAQAAGRLEAQCAVQLPVHRTWAIQIDDLGWLNGEVLILDRQIALQKLIRRVQRGDVREPHLLDRLTLKGVKEQFYPPLRLGRRGPESARSPARSATVQTDSWV